MITTLLTNRSELSPIASEGRSRATAQTAANSFQDNLSEALGGKESVSRRGGEAASSQRLTATLNRQGIGTARRDFAAPILATLSEGTRSPSTATALIPPRTQPPVTPTNTSSSTSASTSVSVQASAPPMPMTPAHVVSNLLQQNAPPPPYARSSQPSTDPSVYSSMSYIEQSNLNFIQQQVNETNQNRFADYTTGVNNWAAGGMQGSPPPPPSYETVDAGGFGQWWNQYTANIGLENAPPISTFVSNTGA